MDLNDEDPFHCFDLITFSPVGCVLRASPIHYDALESGSEPEIGIRTITTVPFPP
jgi:hypothetical protein